MLDLTPHTCVQWQCEYQSQLFIVLCEARAQFAMIAVLQLSAVILCYCWSRINCMLCTTDCKKGFVYSMGQYLLCKKTHPSVSA